MSDGRGDASDDGSPDAAPDGRRDADTDTETDTGTDPEELPADLGTAVDPDAEGRTAFVQALRVSRNAKLGLGAGVVFTAVVFTFFVVIPGTYRSPLWYVALAFVLALSTAGLVATLLTLARAVRLSRAL